MSPKFSLSELEVVLFGKDTVPIDVPADPVRYAIAQAHREAAQQGLQDLAASLEQLAGSEGDGGRWLWPGSAKGGAAINAIRAVGQNLSDANVEKLIKAVNALKGKLGGSLPIDKRSALGNEFWAPGKIWKPDQVDAVISLFSADIARQQPPQQLPPASPPQLPPAP
jgi:hypothetical protein